jgi:hypothetical protein
VVSRLEDRTLLSTYTVNLTSDTGASSGTDAGTGDPSGDLRWAITHANADSTADVINFDLPTSDPNYDAATGSWSIKLNSGLPVITNSLTIDGYTQPGAHPNTPVGGNAVLQSVGANAALKVVLDGQGNALHAIELGAPNCVIKGLVINHITGAGDSGEAIFIDSTAPGFLIQGNYIGTDVTGSSAVPVSQGIECYATTGQIGGTGAGQGNVLSGATTANPDGHTGYAVQVQTNFTVTIQGNLIGTNAAGTAAITNSVGIAVGVNPGADTEVIGGTTPGAGNLISGNTWGALGQFGNGGIFQGNLVGTDITGMKAIPNGTGLSHVDVVGGTATGSRNIVSGNTGDGVAFSNAIQGNYIGTDISGAVALGNGNGVNDAYLSGHLIGGTTAAARNVIAGNLNSDIADASGTVEGNFIGLDVTGEAVPQGPSAYYGIFSANGATITGNDISGHRSGLWGLHGCVVQGNAIGTNAEGTVAIGNNDGIDLIAGSNLNNTIGGTAQGQGNLISGNSTGIYIAGSSTASAMSETIEGNLIGTAADGTTPLGNGDGIYVDSGISGGVTIGGTVSGSGNVIANNNNVGVFVHSSSSAPDSTGVSILGNSIFGNTNIGISLGFYIVNNNFAPLPNTPGGPHTGANDLQNYPALSAAYAGGASTIIGTLNSNSNATFRVEFFANPAPDPSGFGQGRSYLGFTNVTTDSNGNASINVAVPAATSPGEWVSATATAPDGSTSEFSQDVEVTKIPTTTKLTASAAASSFGQNLTFATTITANAGSGTPGGSVDFTDTTTGNDLGAIALVNGIASLTTSSLPVGSRTIMASYLGDSTYLPSSATITVSIGPSIIVTNSTASGALSVSGNASINLPGLVAVDSSSATALSASGNAQITGTVIDVFGGVKKTSGATMSPAPTTGVSLADPLAAMVGPCVTGLTSYGSVSVSGSSQKTIGPGIYSQISVSGNASLTMTAGTYIIEGGGLTVMGNASLSGSGVFIYNAGSNYPNSGGNFGGITFSGTGSFNLSAPTSGSYAGILIFQSRQNTRALSFSGTAMAGMTGLIYAPNALLSMSGNASLQSALDVGMLNLSGNVNLTQIAAGSDGTGDGSGIANTLLAGNLAIYINDPSGLFTSDELARIQDAINTWDTLLAPYNVTISEVSDPTQANMVIDIGSTSACGGVAQGVLGCFNAASSEITMIQGWDWYAGSDPSQIGAGQYDFETTVLHELGHALGLGGSTNPNSPMYETLATGVVDRTVSTQDLNIPDPPAGADPQMAAGFHSGAATGSSAFGQVASAAGSNAVPGPGLVVLMPLPAGGAASSGQSSVVSGQRPAAGDQAILPVGTGPSLIVQGTAGERERELIPRLVAQPDDDSQADREPSSGRERTDPEGEPVPIASPTERRNSCQLPVVSCQFGEIDPVLDELAADVVRVRGGRIAVDAAVGGTGLQPVFMSLPVPEFPASKMAVPLPASGSDSPRAPASESSFSPLSSRLSAVLLAAGLGAYWASALDAGSRRARRPHARGRVFKFGTRLK